MTPEEQRIAIAEACGWLKITKLDSDLHGWQEQGPLEPLPDYLNDLNAVHEAWLTLTQSQRALFQQNLRKVVLGIDDPRFLGELSWLGEAKIANATAAQRAEAFLRTLNLWTD